ncbi:Glutamate-1-semialdehyde 2,1-aminomutase [bacterium HR10]|nr:Glutamate-1-semialdehyde 2,1-aminomutase [bacterium HR10]
MAQEFSRAHSVEWFHRAMMVIPGGVNSPVRAFRAVGGEPLFIRSARGAYLEDVDGNRFIDYVGSWGPMILGHAHPEVVRAVEEAVRKGTSYGAPTVLEVEMAEEIREALPSIEKVRMTSSGTEATMSAIRLARAFTGRRKVVKFEGCYHGHADPLLVRAGSGVATLGLPDSPGVLPDVAAQTLVLPFNDERALEQAFEAHGEDIACVIIEPIVGNMGCVLPKPGFLSKVRELTERRGALLIFDEVITGFRVGYHGAQGLYGIRPDLTCLGKIIGGGLPVGAFGGREEIMRWLAPEGPVYHAGTLSGNPLAMAAGLATLRVLKRERETLYPRLERLTTRLAEGIAAEAERCGVPVRVNHIASMLTVFFTDRAVTDWTSAATTDRERFRRFFRILLERGVYWPPSPFETAFVSAAHEETEIEATLEAVREAMRALA